MFPYLSKHSILPIKNICEQAKKSSAVIYFIVLKSTKSFNGQEGATAMETTSRMNRTRVIAAIVIALILLAIAWFFYQSKQTTEAPSRSTTETRPNTEENIPDSSDNSVRQDGDASSPTTPSPTGTGDNNMQNPLYTR
jgi:cytoskeletal protein RodZ